MLSENSVDWKPCWWKNNGDDNSLRVKTVEMLNMLRVKSNRLVDRKPMWCKTVEILWQCWLNPTPPLPLGIYFISISIKVSEKVVFIYLNTRQLGTYLPMIHQKCIFLCCTLSSWHLAACTISLRSIICEAIKWLMQCLTT